MAIPLCKYFKNCNGCTAQHIDYELQLKNKANLIARAIKFNDIKIFSENPYFYRNRMDFIFHNKGIGLRGKKNIVGIEKCVIADEKINSLLSELRIFFKDDMHGALKSAIIRAPSSTSSISFVLNPDSSSLSNAIEKIKIFAGITSADNIIVAYVNNEEGRIVSSDCFAVKGSKMLNENYMGMKFSYSSQGFFQNNSKMADKMHSYCNSLLKKYDTKDKMLLDLYAGVGCFGIINSSLFREVLIVENDKECIEAANLNISENKALNCKAILQDSAKMRKLPLKKSFFVITDPPRTGMDLKGLLYLRGLKPEVIIYISCNPLQLGKELLKLKDYEIKSAALFDLFPQTIHVEAVVELVLKG